MYVGPTLVLSSRRWTNVIPTYIAFWLEWLWRGIPIPVIHTTEPAHHRAAGLCAAWWCAARLCAIRLGCVEGHPWIYEAMRVSSLQNDIYRVVPGVSSPRIVPGWMDSLLWPNVWYHSAGANPFWRICHGLIVSTLATAVGGERCVWYFGVPVRNWSTHHEIISS